MSNLEVRSDIKVRASSSCLGVFAPYFIDLGIHCISTQVKHSSSLSPLFFLFLFPSLLPISYSSLLPLCFVSALISHLSSLFNFLCFSFPSLSSLPPPSPTPPSPFFPPPPFILIFCYISRISFSYVQLIIYCNINIRKS